MKILVADDSALQRKIFSSLLCGWGYEVVIASDGDRARDVLQAEDAPRIAILDCMMPGQSGLELCGLVRRQQSGYIYTILVSANREQEDVLRGFQVGADDYLCKPFSPLELQARVKVGERIVRAQEELAVAHQALVKAHEALRFEATHDAMTRLWNRGAILDLLKREMSRAGRLHAPLSVFILDIDLFKRVNDTHGHLTGDEVIRRVAARMAKVIREYDCVGRYGGEEFLAVLPGCNQKSATEVAERVRRDIANEPIVDDGFRIDITVSIGVREWDGGEDTSDLLHEADLALYNAKRNGRNQVQTAAGPRGASLGSSGKRYRSVQ